MYDDAQNKTRKEDMRFLDVMMPQVVRKKTFTPVGIPGCELGATLVPETRVAAVQHIYSFQAEPVLTSPAVSS